MKILKTYKMSNITIRDLLMKIIDKYTENKIQIKQDLTDRKIQNIKKTIYQIIMHCFEICLPLFKKTSPEKYIELIDIIIPNII